MKKSSLDGTRRHLARGVLRAGRPLLAALLLAVSALACEDLPTVPNATPQASFIYSPVSPINAGQTSVTFNASASSDSNGSLASYVWNFGDGTAELSSGAAVVAHVFPVAGRCVNVTYTVLLTVVDNEGGRGSASQTVTVVNLPAPTSNECGQ